MWNSQLWKVISLFIVIGFFAGLFNLKFSDGWIIIVLLLIISFISFRMKQKQEEKEYEDAIEKRVRAEQRIREKLEREAQTKNKK